MSDLFQGQTMTEAFKFISAGTAHTFYFNFQPDKVTFYNLSDWTATAAGKPISVWFRGQTTAAHAFQEQVIDSAAAQSFNFLDTATNGFTVADTAGGVTSYRAAISGITQANPCVVTTSAPHGYQTNQNVVFTDLGDVGITDRGMSPLDGNTYGIIVLSSTTFSLYDIQTGDPIDSTGYPAYVSGGSVDMISRVISLNNPQQYPYLVTPYRPTPFAYLPVVYGLTAGTSVMGSDGDVFLIEVIKYGQVTDLGDLLT